MNTHAFEKKLHSLKAAQHNGTANGKITQDAQRAFFQRDFQQQQQYASQSAGQQVGEIGSVELHAVHIEIKRNLIKRR